MNKIYLNHNALNGIEDTEVSSYVSEIINLTKISEKNGYLVKFSNRLWEVPLKRKSLREYLFANENKDVTTPFLMIALGQGPFYDEIEERNNINIVPAVHSNTTILRILASCFNDSQKVLTSLKDESVLLEEDYNLHDGSKQLELKNLTGKLSLTQFFSTSLSFTSIEEVFEKIEEVRPNLIILDSAKKTAKSHNFFGRYIDVYKVLLALVDTELKHIQGQINDEVRKELFQQICGFRISGESTTTMQKRTCIRIREFTLPGKGKQIFEWHAKIGTNTRIHYFIDSVESKVYIGHCGGHLRT